MSQIERETKRVLLLTFGLNFAVAVAKLGYGYLTQSLSLTADGFHSLFDSSSNIVGIIALAIAFKPPDEGHPYGHRKMETLAAMAIAFLLFATCFEMVSGLLERLKNPVTPQITFGSYVVMFVTLAVNWGVSRYELKKSVELRSDILKADAMHTRADLLVSFSVILSFVGVMMKIPVIDTVVACAIIAFIVFIAFKIIYSNFNVLMDAQQIDPSAIEALALSLPGIAHCHKIRSRGSPNGIFVDMHIHVDPKMSLEDAHMLTHKVMDAVKKEHPEVLDVLIHTEPSYSTK